jgi:hypothetical protein
MNGEVADRNRIFLRQPAGTGHLIGTNKIIVSQKQNICVEGAEYTFDRNSVSGTEFLCG